MQHKFWLQYLNQKALHEVHTTNLIFDYFFFYFLYFSKVPDKPVAQDEHLLKIPVATINKVITQKWL